MDYVNRNKGMPRSMVAVQAHDMYLEAKARGAKVTIAFCAQEFGIGNASMSRIAAIHRMDLDLYIEIGKNNVSIERAYTTACCSDKFNPLRVERGRPFEIQAQFDAKLLLDKQRIEREMG